MYENVKEKKSERSYDFINSYIVGINKKEAPKEGSEELKVIVLIIRRSSKRF